MAANGSGQGIGAWLRGLSQDDLTALLERRSDVLHRPPNGIDDLGNRLSQPQSTSAALQQVDRFAVQVVALLAALGEKATARQLADAFGRTEPVPEQVVAEALARLSAVGLAWPVKDAWRSAAGIRPGAEGLLGLAPPIRQLAIGLPLAQLRTVLGELGLAAARSTYEAVDALAAFFEDEKQLRALLDEAPPEASVLLEHLVTAGQGSFVDGSPAEAWLGQRMLLLVEQGRTRVLPREVAALVRGDRLVGVVRREPERPLLPAPPPTAAAEDALRLVEHVRALLAECEAAPPKVLQSGGIGVQAQRKLAKALDWQTEYLAWLLDLAGAARLLGTMGSAGRLTAQADEWRALEEPTAYVALVRAVLDDPAGPRPAVGDPPAPLAGWRYADPSVLPLPLVLAGAVRASGREEDRTLLEWLDWRHYRSLPAGLRRVLLETQLHQLLLLALRVDGACPPWASGLSVGDDEAAVRELAAALPPSQEDAVFQADGTVFVGARPTAGLRALLDAVAEREGERTWRVAADRVRQALDEGRSAEALLSELRERSKHPLPQVVEQLVRDVAARHGRIRVFAASTLLRIDDVPLAVEVLRDKRLKALSLAEVQPGVLSSPKPAKDVLAALRSAGHAPVGERPAARASRAKRAPVHSSTPRSYGPTAQELAEQLRRNPGGSRTKVPVAEALPYDHELDDEAELLSRILHLSVDEQTLLVDAVGTGEPVEIDYVDSGGRRTTRVVADLDVEGHLLVGWCELRGDERMFSPEGILAVRSAS